MNLYNINKKLFLNNINNFSNIKSISNGKDKVKINLCLNP